MYALAANYLFFVQMAQFGEISCTNFGRLSELRACWLTGFLNLAGEVAEFALKAPRRCSI